MYDSIYSIYIYTYVGLSINGSTLKNSWFIMENPVCNLGATRLHPQEPPPATVAAHLLERYGYGDGASGMGVQGPSWWSTMLLTSASSGDHLASATQA